MVVFINTKENIGFNSKKINKLNFKIAMMLFLLLLFPSCLNHANREIANLPLEPDYSDSSNWFSDGKKHKKFKADIFYVYPTVVKGGPSNEIADVTDKEHRDNAFVNQMFNYKLYAGYNFFAPYYRQMSFSVYQNDYADDYVKVSAGDVKRAFNYYMENFNHDRPFVLVGHSQGSQMIIELLKTGMTPEQRKRMVAAYCIGWKITQTELNKYSEELQPAQGATDLGKVIVFNSVTDIKSICPIMWDNAVGINPITWTTDTTYADSTQYLGIAEYDRNNQTVSIRKTAMGARLMNHFMVCDGIDPAICYQEEMKTEFPLGNLHFVESRLFGGNIKQNMKDRVAAYFEAAKME
jgi:hypothetical protein